MLASLLVGLLALLQLQPLPPDLSNFSVFMRVAGD